MGWGDALAVRVFEVLRDYQMSWNAAANILQDFAQGVFHMEGLAEAMATDNDSLIVKRMQSMDMQRSSIRSILLDAKETFERQQTPITGLPEMMEKFALRLAAAAKLPVTLLMGQSPAGLNATGDTDVRWFYDQIKAFQMKTILPALSRLITLVFKSKNGPTKGKVPSNWVWKFNPLWQLAEDEQATLRYTQAQADQIYISTGVVTPEEVAKSRFSGDEYSTETVLDLELRGDFQEAVDRKAENTIGAPAPADLQQPSPQGENIPRGAIPKRQIIQPTPPKDGSRGGVKNS
jgi:phage-related protein (TIGR01555 family)